MGRKRWTVEQVPDLAGKRILITGANSGIGLEAARVFARHGALVVIACRNTTKGEQAAGDLRATAGAGATVEVLELDLADLASVQAAAEEYRRRHAVLDVLVNNAGVMALPFRATVDGFEMQFGTNHLGHFALTGHLLTALLAAPGARVVTISSVMHRLGRMDFANLDASRGYDKWAVYSMSKLANLLFTLELQRRAEAAGLDLTAVAAHPGYSRTHLQSTGPQMAGRRVGAQLWKVLNVVGSPLRAGAADGASGGGARRVRRRLLRAVRSRRVRGTRWPCR